MKDINFESITKLLKNEDSINQQERTVKCEVHSTFVELDSHSKIFRQGCILSPYLFNKHTEGMMQNVKLDQRYTLYIQLKHNQRLKISCRDSIVATFTRRSKLPETFVTAYSCKILVETRNAN